MVKCDFDVTIGFLNFENFGVGVWYQKNFRSRSWICRSSNGVGVRNKK